LDDSSALVRREAAAALGDIGDRESARNLAHHLQDDDADVRFEAAFALASLRDPRGLEQLIAALDTSTRRLDACEGLRRLGSRDAVLALRSVAERIFLAWADRLTAWATLHVLGEPDAAEKIIARADSRKHEERAYALALIGTHRIGRGAAILDAVALNPKDSLRDTAIRALGDLGDEARRPLLQRIAEDEHTPAELRQDARGALEKLSTQGIKP